MTTNQAPKGTVLTGELIDAAENYVEKYAGDDRECIETDVMNAFYQGAEFMRKYLLSAQPASAPLQDEDAKRYQAIRKMLTSTEEENERFVDLMTEVIGDEIGRPTPEQFDKAIAHAIAAQGAKQI